MESRFFFNRSFVLANGIEVSFNVAVIVELNKFTIHLGSGAMCEFDLTEKESLGSTGADYMTEAQTRQLNVNRIKS